MKFAVIALIATVSAIRLEDPNASYAAKAANLAGSLQAVATQQAFEADHFAMHSSNMPPLTLNARLSRPTLELPVPPKRPEATSTQPSRSTVVRRNDHIDQLLEIKLQAE